MDVVFTVAIFGWFQSTSTLSHYREFGVPAMLALCVGILCYGMHPWVAAINFGVLNQILATPSGMATLSTLLFLEVVAKGFERFHADGANGAVEVEQSTMPHKVARVVLTAVRYLPPFSLLFAVFYLQLYGFHSLETLSFRKLSLILSILVALSIAGGSFLLRRLLEDELRQQIEYRLLFLQLLIALLLPVIARWGEVVPLFHGWEIYARFLAVLLLVLLTGGIGYIIQCVRKQRTLKQLT